ncbi:hypothetical protein LV779_08045 [Streptomyces thinghirensis]|nr:hypothetical protein [Streptomyces thinghirensis]
MMYDQTRHSSRSDQAPAPPRAPIRGAGRAPAVGRAGRGPSTAPPGHQHLRRHSASGAGRSGGAPSTTPPPTSRTRSRNDAVPFTSWQDRDPETGRRTPDRAAAKHREITQRLLRT